MQEQTQTNLSYDAQLEALLFYKGEAIKKSELKKIFDITEDELATAIETLRARLSQTGLCLIEHENLISLGTARAASSLIETITKEELTKDLGRAGLETLSIVLYKGPVSRREIDYIRGVNSSFILRNLMIRGLVERSGEQGSRGYTYTPSLDLLMHLGIERIEDLPDYTKIKAELENFEKSSTNDTNKIE